MKLLDGKHVAATLLGQLKKTVGTLTRPPGLAFILIGSDPASQTYVRMKKKKCSEIGIASYDHHFDDNITEKELLHQIALLNENRAVNGILIQQPLPKHLSLSTVLEAIDPAKDVDGFHPLNMGRLLLGETNGFIPCTPQGIHHLLLAYNISLQGQHVVILGRSNIVGKPLAALLVQKNQTSNATVTLAHTGTRHIAELTRTADILIAAIGSRHFVTKAMVKPGAVVVDVGINRAGGKLSGDVDFESVAPLTSYITPVPGGVGPMTIAMLLNNTVLSYVKNNDDTT